jgi:hypothetical protein
MNNEPHTFYFAPEIETNAVSILWRRPEWLPEFLQRFNPEIHIQQPHLRTIIEAINIVYGDLGVSDFAAVTQCVRELGRFEDCGGLDGLNAVYLAHEPTEHTRAVYRHYLEMLETYAKARGSDHAFPVARFSGGDGVLTPNRIQRRDTEPAFLGEFKVAGKSYRAGAYLGELGSLKIRMLPK